MELAGIAYVRKGRLHIKKAHVAEYRRHGASMLFVPMLRAAVEQFNWAYFDAIETDIDLRQIWVFLVWRWLTVGHHMDLAGDVLCAFPGLRLDFEDSYRSQAQSLQRLIEVRFVERFLSWWGFVSPGQVHHWGSPEHSSTTPTPLAIATFDFRV